MKRIQKAKCFNPAWKYVPAVETDIGKRFRAEIARLKKLKEAEPGNVTLLKRKERT